MASNCDLCFGWTRVQMEGINFLAVGVLSNSETDFPKLWMLWSFAYSLSSVIRLVILAWSPIK